MLTAWISIKNGILLFFSKSKKEIFLWGQKVNGFLHINPTESVLSEDWHPVMPHLSVQPETTVTAGRHFVPQASGSSRSRAQQSTPRRLSLKAFRRPWLTETLLTALGAIRLLGDLGSSGNRTLSGSELSHNRPRRAAAARQKGAPERSCQALSAASGEPLRPAEKTGPWGAETRTRDKYPNGRAAWGSLGPRGQRGGLRAGQRAGSRPVAAHRSLVPTLPGFRPPRVSWPATCLRLSALSVATEAFLESSFPVGPSANSFSLSVNLFKQGREDRRLPVPYCLSFKELKILAAASFRSEASGAQLPYLTEDASYSYFEARTVPHSTSPLLSLAPLLWLPVPRIPSSS